MVGRLKMWYPYSTFEGENTIMLLQTARYLVKKLVANVMKKKPLPEQCEYLNDYANLL